VAGEGFDEALGEAREVDGLDGALDGALGLGKRGEGERRLSS
jgi:hypothetical protein